MYQPFVFKLESGNSDALDKGPNKDNLILSSTINIPLNSLGFHTFIHRTKNAMSITKNLQTKNKFYYVVNPFEHVISNYEDSLKNLTKVYLGIKEDNPDILSRAFYKLWEILFLFDIADKKELSYAALAEGPGAFIQSVINYRQKLGSGISNDKIFGVTIHPEKGKYIEMGKQFMSFYNKQVPGLLNIHSTVSTVEASKHNAKDNGDITQVKTIGLFKKDIEKTKEYADLVTADGGFDWDDENFQEQEGYQLILGEIVAALRVQAKNGHFVLKIFETFTIPSIKLIYLLSSFYEETYIYKPFFSRESNSEKYIICKGFKYDQKKDAALLDKKLKTLEAILEGMNSMKFVLDIFPGLDLPGDYIDRFKFMNIKIANHQQIMINDIVSYIKENNYFGEKYHAYREKQIDATKWWTSNFYPPSNNLYVKNKEELHKLLNASLEKYHAEQAKFISTLVK
jgi:23S rRNA U2552 (ribose-2'-O)-methylase RlmE/FtsJ